VLNTSAFDNYRCRAKNDLGVIERITRLEQGDKPPAPTNFELRGFNSNTFDVVLSAPRGPPDSPMGVNGFRIEYMTEMEFKSEAGKWTNARRKDYPFEEGELGKLKKGRKSLGKIQLFISYLTSYILF